jgi:hypothetical protein
MDVMANEWCHVADEQWPWEMNEDMWKMNCDTLQMKVDMWDEKQHVENA